MGLTLEHYIGDLFDGAANMSGVYFNLQALMKVARPSHIHTWCDAHVLNLVISEASSVGVLQQLVFLVCLLNYLHFSMIPRKR